MSDAMGTVVERRPSAFWAAAWDWLKTFLLCAAIALPIRFFVVNSYAIDGRCMEPVLYTGQQVLVFELSYSISPPERGDIIVFRYPLDPSRDYIKRVIALPGETVAISDGVVYINGTRLDESQWPVTPDLRRLSDYPERLVPAGSYFVLGDNRPDSEDSRFWGFVPEENIHGQAFLIWWPFWQASWLG